MAAQPSRGTVLRRRHRHERQAVVFGSLAAGLAVVVLGAAFVYTGTIDPPFLHGTFVTKTPSAAPSEDLPPVPCPPAGTLPTAYPATQVSVYNASDRSGLAGVTADQLAGRGFTIVGKDNYPTPITKPAEIYFGQDGIGPAYTLAAHVKGARLVLDTRQGPGVDLVLGDEFGGLLLAEEVVLDPAAELVGVAGCVPLTDALTQAVPGPTPSETPEVADDGTGDGTDDGTGDTGDGTDDGTGDGTDG